MRNYITNYDPFFERFFLTPSRDNESNLMKTDIKEFKDHYEMKVDLPSVKKEDVKVSLEKGYLTISAVINNEEKEEKENNFIYQERSYGEFSRSYRVGEGVKLSDISAKLDTGVLTLHINKEKDIDKETNHFVEIQ